MEVEQDVQIIQQPDPEAAREIAAIRAQQEAFSEVVDGLIAIYRDFDRRHRVVLKASMHELYEKVAILGESLGVARLSVDHLWRG